MMDVYGTSGFQFGMIMLAVGVVCGFMMGWGVYKTFRTLPASPGE